MKFTVKPAGFTQPFDALRYAGAHLFNAAVLLLTFGRVTSDAVSESSLKMARRQYLRDRAGFDDGSR